MGGDAVVERKLDVTEPFTTGPDVKAAQQVLRSNRFGINFGPGKADSQYGPKTADATRLAKFLLGYPRVECNGEFGPNLYGYLVAKGAPGYKQRPAAFTAPSAARRRQFQPHAPARDRLVAWALWAVAHSSDIHFQETRPIPVRDLPGTLPLTTDCSGSTTLFARWAQAPDPNGLDYDGQGSTVAMLGNLKRITRAQAQPGDLIVFDGPVKQQHVVVLVELGDEPLVASHGSEKGPFTLSLTDEHKAHPGTEVVFLALE
jgi:peptidoglycan hydrolase-like protein with peptidoglycan-binding domain